MLNIFRLSLMVVGIHLLARSEELLELSCFSVTECKQFEHSGLKADCVEGHCHCASPSGDHISCQPLDRKLSNIIGGSCPCTLPNAECDQEQNICFCGPHHMPSGDKRRCIPRTVRWGGECEQDEQCLRGDGGSKCDVKLRQCLCRELYVPYGGRCAAIVGVQANCSGDEECWGFGSHAFCSTEHRHCLCSAGYIRASNKSSCLPVKGHQDECAEHIQCEVSLRGQCVNNRCQCRAEHYPQELRSESGAPETICTRKPYRGQYCTRNDDCHLRSLAEAEQPMFCSYGECNCQEGYVSLNNSECSASAGYWFGSKADLRRASLLISMFVMSIILIK